MKKLSKIAIYSLIFCLVCQTFLGSVAFAANNSCVVCSRMSDEMQEYVNFQVEMIGTLRKISEDKDSYSGLTKRGLFSYGSLKVGANFINSLKSSINKTAQSAVDAGRSLAIATVIIMKDASNLVLSAQGIGDLIILFRHKQLLRDWNTLKEIDESLNDLIRDVGMQGMLLKQIPSDIVEELEEVLEKYRVIDEGSNRIFSTLEINGNATAADVIKSLTSLNTVMKNFFTAESIFVYEERVESFEKTIGDSSSLKIKFNHTYLSNLSLSYACVRGVDGSKNCGNALTRFASDVTSIGLNVAKDFTIAGLQIKQASKKLAEASKNIGKVTKNKYSSADTDLGLTEDQIELLSDVYGINASKLTKMQGISLATILNGKAGKNIKNSVSISSDWIGDANIQAKQETSRANNEYTTNNSITTKDWGKLSDYMKEKSCIKRLTKKGSSSDEELKSREQKCMETLGKNNISLKNNMEIYLKYYTPNGNVSIFTGMIETLNAKISETLNDLESDKAIVMFAQNQDTTARFVEIGVYIHEMVEKIIGSKKGGSNTIVKNLGKACENQCSNKGGSCYY